MQIPIYEGIYVDPVADFRTSYPQNLIPTPKKTGFSDGYLRTAEGIAFFGDTPGRTRGAIVWNDVLYAAQGTRLGRIGPGGFFVDLGDIGDDGNDAVFTFSFDRLAIASNGKLWYYTIPGGLVEVTDPDAGFVKWVVWIAGYFAITDGETIAVTDLADPMSINPLRYGGAEAFPDAIMMLLRINGQLVAVGRVTCEFFQNVGGVLFPFQVMSNALIERGAAGSYAVAIYNQTFAFVGNGIDEAPSVYLAGPGRTAQIATREIDILLREAGDLSTVRMEVRVDKSMQLLYIHLPTKTLVYDISATAIFGKPIWFILTSGTDGGSAYRGRNFTYAYDKWICGDLNGNRTGYLVDNVTTQFGERVPWQFDTSFGFNQGFGSIFHQVELHHRPGAAGSVAVIWHQFSDNGADWSMLRQAQPTGPGQRNVRATWFGCGLMRDARILRFRGMNDTPDSFGALTANVEALTV
jgi:Phage stabilisation protein